MNKRGIKIMAIAKMGKLVEVDIRKLWEHEQYDFSKWLSDKENLELLNDAIGLSLTEVETEVYVGAYRCDLVGKDEVTGEKVIIENQLEASNHDHLGKITRRSTFHSGRWSISWFSRAATRVRATTCSAIWRTD